MKLQNIFYFLYHYKNSCFLIGFVFCLVFMKLIINIYITALHFAIFKKNKKIIRLLLDRDDIDINYKSIRSS